MSGSLVIYRQNSHAIRHTALSHGKLQDAIIKMSNPNTRATHAAAIPVVQSAKPSKPDME